jgi:subtilisin-like proprotein convertase family protein
MKKKLMAMMIGAVLMAGSAQAQGDYSYTFTNGFNNAGVVPDGDISGVAITTNLTGFAGSISNVTLSLNISGGYNGDLYAYLAGPNGGFAVLLNRSGISTNTPFGYGNTGFNVTFSDGAANSIQNYQDNSPGYNGNGQLLNGWQPSGLNIDPQSGLPVFFNAGQTAMLSSFTNLDANGNWTLFLADLSAGGQSTLVSWGLDITTVPEPNTLAIIGLGFGAGTLLIRRRS